MHDEETKHRLTVKTLTSIRTAVKHNITKSATEIRRVVCCEETPLDVRDHRKVQRAVVKARDKEIQAAAPLEIGFSMRGTLGSIKQYAAENDMKATLAKHSDAADSFHLGLRHMFVISSEFNPANKNFSMFYSSPWMLLTTLRVVASEWPLNIFVDLAHGVCAHDVKLIGFGINTLGWNYKCIMFGTIPNSKGEPAEMYRDAWETRFQMHGLRDFVVNWKHCGKDCSDCNTISDILQHSIVARFIRTEEFRDTGRLPVRSMNSDNSGGLVKYVREYKERIDPSIEINVCSVHLLGTT